MITKITINGKTFEVPDGADVSVVGNQVLVAGKEVAAAPADLKLEIVGIISNLQTNRSVHVSGNVGGNVDAGGSVTCGNVGGKVDAGGSVNCGDVGGYVDAGGSVNCQNILKK